MERIEPGCRVFEADLSAWIDGELDAARRAEVDAHVAGCRACAARVEELRAVDRALRALPAPAAGAELRARLAERISRGPASGRGGARAPGPARRRRAPALALPLAAAAALALYLLLGPGRAPAPAASGPQVAERTEPPQVPDRAPEPPEPVPQLAERVEPTPVLGEIDALDAEDLAVALELDTIEDLPVIANLDLLERLLEAEAG